MPVYHFDLNPATVAIAVKLAKLVAQLGEPLTKGLALEKIESALEHGCKFPDLAGIIERAALLANAAPGGGLTEEEGEQIFREAYARGQQDAETSNPLTWRGMIEVCCNNSDHLSERDRDFIASVRRRIVFDDDEPSPKQQKWIRDCYRKVQMNGTQHS
jgi:hypothetical protein